MASILQPGPYLILNTLRQTLKREKYSTTFQKRLSSTFRTNFSLPPGRSDPHFRLRRHRQPFGRAASNRTTHPQNPRPASNPDRGPASTEDTQTDFNALNVFGSAAVPTTSIDVCSEDGFLLDSGLKIVDGDGLILVGGEAFVWRPWMAGRADQNRGRILKGEDIRKADNGTGGLINRRGYFEIPPTSLGVLALVWPKPDLVMIGTGEKIRPLEQATKEALHRLGVRTEVLDTRNAASQFNMLATERGTAEVAAAMVPVGFDASPAKSWAKN